MATLKVDWKQTGLISVFEESQGLGFDLRKFDRLHEDVQASLKKATVARVLKVIRDTWDKGVEDTRNKHWFGEVRNGI